MSEETESVEMSYEAWVETYKPEENHIVAEDREYDGRMFETFGPEVEYVKTVPDSRIWTIIQADDGGLYITNGYHFVNRIGYFVTGVPYEGKGIEICVGDPDRYEVESGRLGFDVAIVDTANNRRVFCTFTDYETDQGYSGDAEQRAEALCALMNEADFDYPQNIVDTP